MKWPCFLFFALVIAQGTLDATDHDVPAFERILEQIELTPETIWKRLISSEYHCSSLPDDRHAFFDYYIDWPTEDVGDYKVNSITVDDHGDSRTEMMWMGQNRPGWFRINEKALIFGASSRWELRNFPDGWCFQVDSHHILDPWLMKHVPKEGQKQGFIRVNPGPFLSECFGPNVPALEWHSATRCLIAVKKNGTVGRVRFRTPSDQRTFGTILAEVYFQSYNSGELSIRSLIVDRESPLRLNLKNVDTLPERLNAIDERNKLRFAGFSNVKSAESRKELGRLTSEIGLLNCENAGVRLTGSFGPRDGSDFQRVMTWCFLTEHQPVGSTKSVRQDSELLDTLVRALEAAYPSIEAAITKDQEGSLVDDPNLLWLGMERAITGRGACLLGALSWRLLKSEHVTLSDKIRVCCAIGEFGPPRPSIRRLSVVASDAADDQPFLHALLHARWNWPPTENEIAICEQRITDVDGSVSAIERHAAIGCLVRWGEFEKVTADQLQDWLRSASTSSTTHRYCTFKALSRTENGRELLLHFAEDLTEQPDVQKSIARILMERRDSTIEMGRHDFMSQSECELVLERCRKLSEF